MAGRDLSSPYGLIPIESERMKEANPNDERLCLVILRTTSITFESLSRYSNNNAFQV